MRAMPPLRASLLAMPVALATMLAGAGIANAGPDTVSNGNAPPESPVKPAAPSPLDAFPDPTGGTDDPLWEYRAALPALMQASDNKACAKCFMERYAPATFNKAFAVSQDGAFGGRWSPLLTLDQARDQALGICQRNKAYSPAHPCFIFFENDEQVWKP